MHRHAGAYAAIVLAGGYEELGSQEPIAGGALEDVWRALPKPDVRHALTVRHAQASIPLQLTTARLL